MSCEVVAGSVVATIGLGMGIGAGAVNQTMLGTLAADLIAAPGSITINGANYTMTQATFVENSKDGAASGSNGGISSGGAAVIGVAIVLTLIIVCVAAYVYLKMSKARSCGTRQSNKVTSLTLRPLDAGARGAGRGSSAVAGDVDLVILPGTLPGIAQLEETSFARPQQPPELPRNLGGRAKSGTVAPPHGSAGFAGNLHTTNINHNLTGGSTAASKPTPPSSGQSFV